LYDVSLIVAVHNETAEFDLFNTREICYWLANSNSKSHIERSKILQLPSEKDKVDYVKKYNTEYAERQLRQRMNKIKK